MDVDIDFSTEFDPLTVFPRAVPASRYDKGKLLKHPAGAYLQDIPIDGVTQLAAIPFDRAEEFGYFKIDFLHLSAIDEFTKHITKAQMREMVNMEPDWNLLLQDSVVEKLFQIHKHATLLRQIKPTNMMMLADVIAIVRPHGRKLLQEYLKCKTEDERDVVRKILYSPPDDNSYYYKKPHSVGYAATIVIQLHLIELGLL